MSHALWYVRKTDQGAYRANTNCTTQEDDIRVSAKYGALQHQKENWKLPDTEKGDSGEQRSVCGND